MTFRIHLQGLTESLGNEQAVRDVLPAQDIDLGDQRYRALEPVSFALTLTHTGAGIVCTGTASTRFSTECSRCLRTFDLPVSGDVETFFVDPGDEAVLPEEQECELIVDDAVDLEPAIRQAIAVELPFAPLHAEDCAGICPVCGEDRNESSCGCAPASADSPFSQLKDLFTEP